MKYSKLLSRSELGIVRIPQLIAIKSIVKILQQILHTEGVQATRRSLFWIPDIEKPGLNSFLNPAKMKNRKLFKYCSIMAPQSLSLLLFVHVQRNKIDLFPGVYNEAIEENNNINTVRKKRNNHFIDT